MIVADETTVAQHALGTPFFPHARLHVHQPLASAGDNEHDIAHAHMAVCSDVLAGWRGARGT
jgi:hypothetical protein